MTPDQLELYCAAVKRAKELDRVSELVERIGETCKGFLDDYPEQESIETTIEPPKYDGQCVKCFYMTLGVASFDGCGWCYMFKERKDGGYPCIKFLEAIK